MSPRHRLAGWAFGLPLSAVLACGSDTRTPTFPSVPVPVPVPVAPLTLDGTVRDFDDGSPVEGVLVRIAFSGSPSSSQTFTDVTGHFTFLLSDLPSTPSSVSVSRQDYENGFESVIAGRALDIRMRRLRTVVGVVAEIDGGPISGVHISASNTSQMPQTFTDAAGRFSLPAASYITIEKGGYVRRFVTVSERAGSQDLGILGLQRELTLTEGANLSSTLSPNDVEYQFFDDLADPCSPCQWIKLEKTSAEQDIRIHLRWSGSVPLQLWATSDYYGGTMAKGMAKPGESELSVILRSARAVNLLLIGLPSASGRPMGLQEPVAFELTTSAP